MKIRTTLTAALVSGVFVSAAIAQDQEPTIKQDQQPTARVTAEQVAPKRPNPNPLNLPTSPILPMSNPIAPMTTAPVQPFVRYQGPQGTPTVVVPPAKTEDRDGDRRRSNRDEVPVVIVGGPYLPYYDSGIYQPPLLTPSPVPGTLPGTYPVNVLPSQYYAPPAPEPAGTVPGSVPAPAAMIPQETTYYPDSNIIITPEVPAVTVERPKLGISRADAVERYGEPWGSVTIKGRETLYFRGGLVVGFENSRAVEVR
jgi:hypothetical protein